MRPGFRVSILVLAFLLTLTACGRHSSSPVAQGQSAPKKEIPVAPESESTPAPESESDSQYHWPGGAGQNEAQNGDQNWWWLLLAGAAVKPVVREEAVEKLCGKFQLIEGVIKFVQTRTRGRRTYLPNDHDPRYALDTHYCFRGSLRVQRGGKNGGGGGGTTFDIQGWAEGFENHPNARTADGLPPLPRTSPITCDEDLTG